MKVLICDLKGEVLNYALAIALEESPYIDANGEVRSTFTDGSVGRWNPTENLETIVSLLSSEGYDLEDLFEPGLEYDGSTWSTWVGGVWYDSESLTDLIAQQWIRHLTGKYRIKIKRRVLAKLGHVFEHEVTQVHIINVYGPAGCGKSQKLVEMVEKFGCYGGADGASNQTLEFDTIKRVSEIHWKPLLVISQEPIIVPQDMGVIYHDFRTLEFYKPDPDATVKEMFKDAMPLFTLVVNAPELMDEAIYDKLHTMYGPYWQFASRVRELSTSEFQVVCEFFDRKLLVITTMTECQPLVPSTRIEWDEFVKDL